MFHNVPSITPKREITISFLDNICEPFCNLTVMTGNLQYKLVECIVIRGVFAIIKHLIYLLFISAVVWPLHYFGLVTRKTIMVMIATAWLTPLLVLLPIYIYAMNRGKMADGSYYVGYVHQVVTISLYVIIGLILSILYGKIYIEARAQMRKIQAFAEPTETKKAAKGTRVVLIIMSTTILLNFPYVLQAILKLAGIPPYLFVFILEYIAQECLFANSAINILIYAVFTTDFRKAYKAMFCRCGKEMSSESDDHVYST